MKAKLLINGKEFEIKLSEEEVRKLTRPKIKTGYERVEENKTFYYVGIYNEVNNNLEINCNDTMGIYATANYYSDKIVAINNARADRLMRQLRRFAVGHRKEKSDWKCSRQKKYSIYYDHNEKSLNVWYINVIQDFGQIYFDSPETAKLAIETFKDELIWYFTEYKDSL